MATIKNFTELSSEEIKHIFDNADIKNGKVQEWTFKTITFFVVFRTGTLRLIFNRCVIDISYVGELFGGEETRMTFVNTKTGDKRPYNGYLFYYKGFRFVMYDISQTEEKYVFVLERYQDSDFLRAIPNETCSGLSWNIYGSGFYDHPQPTGVHRTPGKLANAHLAISPYAYAS